LELFGLENKNIDLIKINESFVNSKVYKWLLNVLNKENNKEIYFGNLSNIIHNSLLDDPRPYRKDVKELQRNLFDFLKNLKLDEIQLDQPNFSQRIRLIS